MTYALKGTGFATTQFSSMIIKKHQQLIVMLLPKLYEANLICDQH